MRKLDLNWLSSFLSQGSMVDWEHYLLKLWILADRLFVRSLQKLVVSTLEERMKVQESYGLNSAEETGILRNLLEKIALCAAWFVRESLGLKPEPFGRFVEEESEGMRRSTRAVLLDLIDGYGGMMWRECELGIMQRWDMAGFLMGGS